MNKFFATKNAEKYTYTLQNFQQQNNTSIQVSSLQEKNLPLQKSKQQNSTRQLKKFKTEENITIRQSLDNLSQNCPTFFQFNKQKAPSRNRVASYVNFAKPCQYVPKELFNRKIRQIEESVQCLNAKIGSNTLEIQQLSAALDKGSRQYKQRQLKSNLMLCEKLANTKQLELIIEQIKAEVLKIPGIVIKQQQLSDNLGQFQEQLHNRLRATQQQIMLQCQKFIKQMFVNFQKFKDPISGQNNKDLKVQSKEVRFQKGRGLYRYSSYKSGICQSFKVKCSETMEVQKNNKVEQLQVSQTVYLIDEEGFILDESSNYLINDKGFRIKLDQKHLSILRDSQMLKS